MTMVSCAINAWAFSFYIMYSILVLILIHYSYSLTCVMLGYVLCIDESETNRFQIGYATWCALIYLQCITILPVTERCLIAAIMYFKVEGINQNKMSEE